MRHTSPDPALHRTCDGFHQLTHDLCRGLPPPEDGSRAALARRNNAAIAQVAALLPVSVAEANLAVQHVAAAALALHAMCRAQNPDLTPAEVTRFYAQSAGFMRQSQSALRALERMQAARTKRAGDAKAANSAIWIEDAAAQFMGGAVSAPPPQERQTPPAEAEEPPADPQVAAAEEYAREHPDRAALIRHLGRLPANVSFGPPEDAIVLALVIADTPVLQEVDAMMAPRIQDGSLLRGATPSR